MNLEEFDKLLDNVSFKSYQFHLKEINDELLEIKKLKGRNLGVNGVWRKVGRIAAFQIQDQLNLSPYYPNGLKVTERILKELEGTK